MVCRIFDCTCMMTLAQLKKIRRDFGARVRELRKERGYSQEGFADACGLHRTYIGAIERGERNVAIDNIAKIAAALNIKISQLF